MEQTGTKQTDKVQKKELPTEHQVLLAWWHDLENHRGDRAALRRAASIDQVFFNPAFHRLWRGLKGTSWQREDRVGLIAALAARVPPDAHDASQSFATQLGTPRPGQEKAPLSGLRFRRLLQVREPDAILQALVRAIALCKNRVNLTNLAESVYWWNDGIHKQWAFHYYDANPKAD